MKKKRLRKNKKLRKKVINKKSVSIKDEDGNSICSKEEIQDDEGNTCERSIYDDYDYIELRNVKNFSKIRSEVQKTIFEAKQEIKKLEKDFFTNEHNISITKSRFPDDCVPVNADIRLFDWHVTYNNNLFRN